MQIRGLAKTVLGVYLITEGVLRLLPVTLIGLAPLVALAAVAAGVLLLLDRRR